MKRQINGWWFPATDTACSLSSFIDIHYVPRWLDLAKGRNVAVQAGGNCGMFPAYLATQFEAVYTAEPEPDNFWCLVTNCASLANIYPFRCAFGEEPGSTALNVAAGNAGAHYIGGKGHIPILRIDDLGVAACDLLALDVEGAEFMALKGAERTIERFRPLIVTEDKGHDVERFGAGKGEMHKWLEEKRYSMRGFIGRDSIWIP